MTKPTWLPIRILAACLALVAAMATMADDPDPTPPKKSSKSPRDPAGTTVYMAQLRLLWDSWDENKDGFVDKEELRHIFRGPSAKPYDAKTATKTDPAKTDPAKNAEKKDDKKDAKIDDKKDVKKDDKKPVKKPDYAAYPDHAVLIALDQNGDGRISRDEFMSWAREYAVQLKHQDAALLKVSKVQDKLAKASPSSKTYSKLQTAVKDEQAALDKFNHDMTDAARAVQRLQKDQMKAKK